MSAPKASIIADAIALGHWHGERGNDIATAREGKHLWKHSIYCDGQINRDFLKFREGYALAKAIYQGN